VDEFALGVHVIGASSSIQFFPIKLLTLPSAIRSPDAWEVWDGTSASCAKVSGIIAIALSRAGQVSPYTMYDAVIKNSIPVVTGQPEGTTCVSISAFCVCYWSNEVQIGIYWHKYFPKIGRRERVSEFRPVVQVQYLLHARIDKTNLHRRNSVIHALHREWSSRIMERHAVD
jgi:hypothetical protein